MKTHVAYLIMLWMSIMQICSLNVNCQKYSISNERFLFYFLVKYKCNHYNMLNIHDTKILMETHRSIDHYNDLY